MTHFNAVNWVDVVHAIDDNPADFLQLLVATHSRHGVSLYKHVTLCQKLNSLQRGPVGAYDTLTTLDEALAIPYETSDFDDIARDIVLQNLESLRGGYTTGKEFDEIASFEEDVRVEGFSCCTD
jgi:hypothetical protein